MRHRATKKIISRNGHFPLLGHTKNRIFFKPLSPKDKIQTLHPAIQSPHSIVCSIQSSVLLIHCLSPALHNHQRTYFTLTAFSPK